MVRIEMLCAFFIQKSNKPNMNIIINQTTKRPCHSTFALFHRLVSLSFEAFSIFAASLDTFNSVLFTTQLIQSNAPVVFFGRLTVLHVNHFADNLMLIHSKVWSPNHVSLFSSAIFGFLLIILEQMLRFKVRKEA